MNASSSRIQRILPFAALTAAALCSSFALGAATSPVNPQPEKPKTGFFQTKENVSDIAFHVTAIEKRLEGIEQSVQSVKGIDKSVSRIDSSLAEVAGVVRAESLRSLEESAGEVMLARGSWLILLATACCAALIVLHAVLRRWYKANK